MKASVKHTFKLYASCYFKYESKLQKANIGTVKKIFNKYKNKK